MTRLVSGVFLLILWALAPSALAQAASPSLVAEPDAINAVVGDASWWAAHGRAPQAGDGEVERIRTHLYYVWQRLGEREVSHLSLEQRERRGDALVDLERYARRGVFPRRTSDDFVGRRPRFIDDRGVHCAVGHLIAMTGTPELAQAIDEQYEYAYVNEINSPELRAWAASTGFTAQELAMIQPGYRAPPTAESTEEALVAARDAIALECAREHVVPKRVRVEVIGDRSGRVRVVAIDKQPFAKCFARLASAVERGDGAYDGAVHTYRFAKSFELTDLRAQLERAMQGLVLEGQRTGCVRPGVLPRTAIVEVAIGPGALSVRVSTVPANAEVTTCLEDYVRRQLHAFAGGSATANKSRREFRVAPAMTSTRLRLQLRADAPRLATDCYPEDAPPARVRVTVDATRDAKAFAIEVSPGDGTFGKCLVGKLQTQLRQVFSVSRQRADGRNERYFRIDSDARADYEFALESPQRRHERMQRELRERREPPTDF